MKTIGALIALSLGTVAVCAEKQINLIDYFKPMQPQGEMVSEGIWGAPGVLPRDIKNGLEDPEMKTRCYWDGSIVPGEDGRFHLFGCGWTQTVGHGPGWTENSKAIHAVSDNIMGPYVDQGMMWPHWMEGEGCNVVGMRTKDGRWAAITSETTKGEIFTSDSPDGPWEFHGDIEVDLNGHNLGLARYPENGRMANVQIVIRPDGRYMLVGRTTAVMISEDSLLGPYHVMSDRIYKGMPGVPQKKMEDATFWRSGSMYHMIVNRHGLDTSYHFTSEDGISDWKSRGIAFKKDAGIFCYPDGTVNEWGIVQRMTVHVSAGHPSHFLFSVIDVLKGQDGPNDMHGSKIVIVPIDGESLDRDLRVQVDKENAVFDATPAPGPWISSDIGNSKGRTGYDPVVKTVRVKTKGKVSKGKKDACRFHYQKVSGDVMLTVQILSQDITPDMATAGIMLRKSLAPDAPQTSAWIAPDQGLLRQVRKNVGIANETVTGPKVIAPYYLRLVKQGNKVTSYISRTNIYNWEEVGSFDVDLGEEFYAGVAAASSNGKQGLARFKALDVHTLGTQDQLISHNLPSVVPASGKVTVRVTYETSEPRYLDLGMRELKTWKGFSSVNQKVNGYGVLEFEYAPKENLDPEIPYFYMISLRPKPNDWKNAFDNHSPMIESVTPER